MDIKQVLQGVKSWVVNNYYDKDQVDQLLGVISSVNCYEVYSELPNEGQGSVIYLIGPIGNGADKYEEYIYSNSEFIKIGDTSVDLSGYLQDSDIASWAKAENKPSYDYSEIANTPVIPEVPSNISAFTNDAGYLTSHQDISGKQDVISDLAEIRSGAALGSTALQEHQDISGKQDVIADLADIRSGAALGSTALQEHQDISGKANIGDSYTKAESDEKYLTSHQDISGKANVGDSYTKAESDEKYLTEHQDISGKQNVINDLGDIRSGAALGATSIQSHQDISGKANIADLATVATSGSYDDLNDKPTIPTVPSNVSEFTNDAGYLTEHQTLKTVNGESLVGEGNVDTVLEIIDFTGENVGTLTNEQYEKLLGNNCAVRYDNRIYHKAYTGDNGFDYRYAGNMLTNDDVTYYYFTVSHSTKQYTFGTSVDARPRIVANPSNLTNASPLTGLAVGFEHYNIPEVPSNVSAFTNDAGYLTSHQDISGKANIGDSYTKAESDAKYLTEHQSLSGITDLIPAAASDQNQLADKEFVNSSIATATATFKGTFNLVSDLELAIDATQIQIAAALTEEVSGEDNNDYAFVQIPNSAETPAVIARVDRYKFSGNVWVFEFSLNNSGYTAAQWDSINSGISASDVTKLAALPTNSELSILLSGKVDKVSGKGLSTEDFTTAEKTKLSELPTNSELNTALSEKANSADLAAVATSGAYSDLSGTPTIPTYNVTQDFMIEWEDTYTGEVTYQVFRVSANTVEYNILQTVAEDITGDNNVLVISGGSPFVVNYETAETYSLEVTVMQGQNDTTVTDLIQDLTESPNLATVSIKAVTKNINITVDKVARVYQIRKMYYGITETSGESSSTFSLPYTNTLSATLGGNYKPRLISVKSDGIDVTSTSLDSETNEVSTDGRTKQFLDLYAVAFDNCRIVYDLVNVTSSNTDETVEWGSNYTTILSPTVQDHVLNKVEIWHNGYNMTDTYFDSTANTVTVTNLDGDLLIVAYAYDMPEGYTRLESINIANSGSDVSYCVIDFGEEKENVTSSISYKATSGSSWLWIIGLYGSAYGNILALPTDQNGPVIRINGKSDDRVLSGERLGILRKPASSAAADYLWKLDSHWMHNRQINRTSVNGVRFDARGNQAWTRYYTTTEANRTMSDDSSLSSGNNYSTQIYGLGTALQTGGEPYNPGRINGLKIKDAVLRSNDAVFAMFVPARRNSDDELGFYDVYGNLGFITNAGTKPFTATELS